MPQFELEHAGEGRISGLYRGRDAEDAIRRALDVEASADLRVDSEEDVQGWRVIVIDGRPAGRIRLHQRMRFRRD